MPKGWTIAATAITAGIVACLVGLPLAQELPVARFPAPRTESRAVAEYGIPPLRDEMFRRAKVWISASDRQALLAENPPDPTGLLSREIVRCHFLPKPAEGTTPKFRCVLEDGEVIKVKYGHTGEVPAEVAASRLVRALGFGADRMYIVPTVRCYGCPRFPFQTMWTLDRFGAGEALARALPSERYVDFEWTAVERHFEGDEITGTAAGWAWHELADVNPAAGATRAEIDALRLLARFIGHWDNKAANQRLVCRPPGLDGDGRCAEPFALMQDLGATFGPNKVNLEAWGRYPLWADARQCRISMRDFPYHGATFTDVTISEGGRRLLARELATLDREQLEGLFRAARFPEFHRQRGRGADVTEWARAFERKREEIASAGPCPDVGGAGLRPVPTGNAVRKFVEKDINTELTELTEHALTDH